MIVRLTKSNHLLACPGDSADDIIDFILNHNYQNEFILADSFEPAFLAELMSAGFLVMSDRYQDEEDDYILIPKHHNIRTVLFFENLHTGKTIKRFLPHYELRAGSDYEEIVDKCVALHGDDWLTPPLLEAMQKIRDSKDAAVHPSCFGVYKNNELRAGEFGVIAGRVYTSYSGYYEESSAGRVQLILTARYLRDNGFAFWDLGMPIDYKYTIGAHDVDTREFVSLFRAARYKRSFYGS